MQRLETALAGRYRIERELGRGGMAAVFLAEDLKHHRRVAIKVMDPGIGAALGPERFLREVETAARLTHPHILPLFDSGDADGLLFYVMPYVEGESLRQRLVREGALPLEDALRITGEIAEALRYAHQHGIIHRDIKPENVLLESGHAVVADFGLARALGSVSRQRLTTVGVTLGTPAYMSPEQAAAADGLDGRCDQYSLACLLFEMLAGQPPFLAATAQSLLHQHLNVAPRPVTELRPSTPPGVRDVVARALSKSPADRFPDMDSFGAALKTALPAPQPGAAGTTTGWATTAAVEAPTRAAGGVPVAGGAPHRRIGRGRGLAWLAAGVLLAALASWLVWQRGAWRAPPPQVRKDWILVAAFDGPADDSSLAVTAHDLLCAAIDQSKRVATVPREYVARALRAAGRPAGTRVDVDLARELAYRSNVRTVLEGRLGRVGAGYSIVLRLMDADSARTIVTLSGAARNADALIPALGGLAGKLRAALGENRRTLAATRSIGLLATPSFEALKRYVAGRERMTRGENVQALTEWRSALALDPDFAVAWYSLSFPYSNLGCQDSVIWACDQALRHPDRLDDPLRLRIQVTRSEAGGDWQGAMDAVDRALIENPNSLWALGYSDLLWKLGRYQDALDRVRRLERLRPFGAVDVDRINEANSLSLLGRADEARRVGADVTGFWHPWLLGLIEMRAGNYAVADSLARTMLGDPRHNVENLGGPELILAWARKARGAIRSSDSCYASFWERASSPAYRWGDLAYVRREQNEFLALCVGRITPLPVMQAGDTTAALLVTRGLAAAHAGDLEEARRCLARARTRPQRERISEGASLALLEARLAAAQGRWEEVVRVLEPLAATRPFIGSGDEEQAWIRWTMADAYERLGRPDSAAVDLERIVHEPRTRAFRAYASLRLVPLYMRLGRPRDAMRHWARASRALDLADPAIVARLGASHAALASAL